MLDVQDFVSGRVLDFVQVLARCILLSLRDDKTNYLLQYCIACNVPTLDCLHNRVSSLASLGRLVVLEEGFAQVPLIGLEKVRKKYSNGRVKCLVREN